MGRLYLSLPCYVGCFQRVRVFPKPFHQTDVDTFVRNQVEDIIVEVAKTKKQCLMIYVKGYMLLIIL